MNKVKIIIDEWDPAELLCIHCPDDEYDNEIFEIIEALSNVRNAQELAVVIQKVFTECFGEENLKWNYTQCVAIEEKILSS